VPGISCCPVQARISLAPNTFPLLTAIATCTIAVYIPQSQHLIPDLAGIPLNLWAQGQGSVLVARPHTTAVADTKTTRSCPS